MAEPIRGGKLTVLNPVPPIRRVWLRASQVLRELLSAIPEETLNSVRNQPPQPFQEPSTPSSSSTSTVSYQTIAQATHPAVRAPSYPPIAFQEIIPDHGPISGGEKILLVGSGFSEGQDLLVRFGDGTKPVRTELVNPHNLRCTLPPSDSARCVSVTLHSQGTSIPEIHNEEDVLFTYEDVDKEFKSLCNRVLDHRRLKTSHFEYNSLENSFSATFSLHTSAPTPSQSPPTTQAMATSPIQGEILSSDWDQLVTEDDLLSLLGSISWSLQDCDSINLVNNRGQNLAHFCAQLGYHRLLTAVIESGAHIQVKDVNGWTPLDFARLHRDEDAVDILEGDWEDYIQNTLSTGSLPIDLLHRFVPGVRNGPGFVQVQSLEGALEDDNTRTIPHAETPTTRAQPKFPSSDTFAPYGPPDRKSADPSRITLADDEAPSDFDDGDNIPIINNVESLRQGIIKTSRNKVQAPYTILLVGETGVGKSTFLEFIANVVIGNTLVRYNFDLLDHTNERGLSNNHSQTNSARFYEFVSNNGIMVRFLDTPGLADTRGIQQDELHKRSIASEIQKHVGSVNAILVLLQGTIPRITHGTDYALHTLSTIFPKTVINNIAFVFTNVLSPLSWNFSQDTVPKMLKGAPQFHLDNPVALQKKYLKLKDGQSRKNVERDMRNHVKAGEQKALEMLVKLFDWLDRLEPQPTREIIELYEMSQEIEFMITNTLAQIDQAAARTMEVDRLMATVRNNSDEVKVLPNFEETVVWKQQRTFTNNLICGQHNCYSNCYIDYKTNIPLTLKGLLFPCRLCNHSLWNHHRCHALWEPMTSHGLVDQNMKRRWEAARDGKGKEAAAALLAVSGKMLRDLNDDINHAASDLERLVERYADLSLSGNFSAQVDSTVRLLEQNYTVLEKKGVSEDQLNKVERSLDHMKRKLAFLTTSKANMQKESIRIGFQKSFE